MYQLIKNKKINALLPIILALCCIGLFLFFIIGFENHKKQGDDLYVALAPLDPRSLLQGDYMALNYDLNITNPNVQFDESGEEVWNSDWHYDNAHIKDKGHITLWITKDKNNKLIKSDFQKHDNTVALIVKNPTNYLNDLYPAAKSFLFAEGLAKCYEKAKYAHLKLTKKGKPLLVDLVGEDFRSLGCEKNE
ncbi:GDYXXLXY domain-containing protein [Moraxella oblonga]|uniref:GDYXXLXY domain-containing protein n=1 Tax=Moraxella oblonga TaxID=200413 RepID=UPI00083608E9|nr:GDYXXLXY domain-containing protein [Moraxella oblonga]